MMEVRKIMRKIIEFSEVQNKKDFWIYFLMSNFPESLDIESDETICDIISEKYNISSKWIDSFTGYYEGVFEEKDGYIDNPNTIKIQLDELNYWYIEMHPSDTIYFLNNIEIGCTGAEYFIRNIYWDDLKKYIHNLTNKEKILLLPMVIINKKQREELFEIIYITLNELQLGIEKEDLIRICYGVIENCLDLN